ncbi:MAG: immunity protein YezG family protein [Peptoanaerobacter stomatis]|uniref:immunity protein YezG family protein n=1 Tax=Peptoanaerobacter stomatis TaxID=796937 RepID=UPI003FA07E25
MNNQTFQNIFDILEPVLPKEWENMILFIAYTKGSYTMKYYTCDNKRAYVDCFKSSEVDRNKLIKLFIKIDKILSEERNLLEEKDKWTVMTMIVDSDGKMKSEFDYEDISENFIEYEKEWKEKYIK